MILSKYKSFFLQALSCTFDGNFTYAINLCTKQINLAAVNGLQHITTSNNCINITIIAENEFGTRRFDYLLNATNSGCYATTNHQFFLAKYRCYFYYHYLRWVSITTWTFTRSIIIRYDFFTVYGNNCNPVMKLICMSDSVPVLSLLAGAPWVPFMTGTLILSI